MITRRKLITGASTVGGVALIAGCSGNAGKNEGDQTGTDGKESDETDEDSDEEPVETDEIGSQIFVQDISYSYTFSGGLSSTVQVVNDREQGSGAVQVNVSMVAYDGETELGEASVWDGVTATSGQSEYDENNEEEYQRFAKEFEINIGEISQTGDHSIDDITEVVIRGRTQQDDYTRIETISGLELRENVNN